MNFSIVKPQIPNELKSMTVGLGATILEVIKTIDEGAHQIALVLDDQAILRGVVTDGDLRRALLSGTGLNDPVQPFVSKQFHSVSPQASRSEALDLMMCHHIHHLPIVNQHGQLYGLHLLNALVQPTELPNAALILAGGKGTRLGKLTEKIPKPMLKVAGRPILERILLHLIGAGIRQFYLSVNYLSEVVEDHFGTGEELGCSIEYLRESEPLGTGGPLALLRDFGLSEPVFVMNGDLITEFDPNQMLQLHGQENNSITVGVKRYSHQFPFGCVETDGSQITELVEKPVIEKLVNSGIYLFSPDSFVSLPRGSFPITEVIEIAMASGRKVGAFPIDSWLDVGHPESISLARGHVA